jgi:4'-phosphopantetheinyl transferase EntD
MRPALSDEAVRAILRGRVGVGVAAPDERGAFVMGRAAAGRAMADLGTPPTAIPAGPDRAPVWPARLVGSIAHTRTVAIAVVAWAEEFGSLGVDVEGEGRPIDARTARRIGTPQELEVFTEPDAVLALFCAKEATYKALAPLGATRLGFQEVSYSPAGPGLLDGRIVGDGVDPRVPRAFSARYVVAEGYVIASVQIDLHAS